VGIRSRGGEVAAERVSVILPAQRFSDRSLGANSDAVLCMVAVARGSEPPRVGPPFAVRLALAPRSAHNTRKSDYSSIPCFSVPRCAQ
jgi:hypothetical protein